METSTAHVGKKKKKVKKNQSDEFTIETIQELDGEKLDFEILKDVEDESEVIEGGPDGDSQGIKKDELLGFLEELGIRKYRPNFKKGDEEEEEEKKPEKKVKLLVAPWAEEAEKEDEEVKTKKKKKEKNKYKQLKEVQDDAVSSTTPTKEIKEKSISDFIADYKPRKHLLLKPLDKWYNLAVVTDEPTVWEPVSDVLKEKLRNYAQKLLEDDVAVYNSKKLAQKKSDAAWIRTVLVSGTMADKMAALTLVIQEDPVHTLASIDTLITLVSKKGRREYLMALDTLKDLFLSDLLPDERKLKKFHQHPLAQIEELTSGNRDARDKKLMLWYYEDQLKSRYFSFIKALETISQDTLHATKKKAMGTTLEMLVAKPEEEKQLLIMLINKLGDPHYKTASLAAHFLTRLVEQHPRMKMVVTLEVERLLYRPNINLKAQYYAVCFLNQIALSHGLKDLASRLITIYFSFFKSFVKKGDVDSKMLGALLTGVNRAYPFAKMEKAKIEEQMNTLYKVVHMVNFSTSLQALMLLYQVMDSSDVVSDRYYTALYKKMTDPALKHSSKQNMFLNLLFKSMKKDMSERRNQAFIKRLLQICSYQHPPFVCAALYLMSEVLKVKPGLLNFAHLSIDSDEEEHFVDAEEPPTEGETVQWDSDDDKDDKDDDDDEEDEKSKKDSAIKSQSKPKPSSWVHRKNLNKAGESHGESYNPMNRNPQYSHAENECVWELQQLASHYHPSVALFAQTMLKGESVSCSGDPLQDFTLIRFLDRFVYRNPKKKGGEAGERGVMQSSKRSHQAEGVRGVAVNTEEFLQYGEEAVPPEERFFYRYFSEKAALMKGDAPDDVDSDTGSISDTEFDDYLDNYEQSFVNEDKDMFDDLDFAGEFTKQKSKKKTKKKKGDESDGEDDDDDDVDDDDDDDIDELSDEEPDFADADFGDAFDSPAGSDEEALSDGDAEDFDEEGMAFSEEEDEFAELDGSKSAQRKRKGNEALFASPAKKQKDNAGLFAAAEEFAHLMDDNAGGDKFDMTGSGALSNKDKSHAKQLKWEVDRDKWVRGADWKSKKGRGRGRGKGNTKSFKRPGGGAKKRGKN